jgi:hypothetical protein
MRNLVLSLTALAAFALCACGPSSKDIAMAKTARYKGDKLQLFADAKTAVETNYKLVRSDEIQLARQTDAKWYTPEGMVVTRTGSPERGEGLVPDRSVNFAATVTLLPDGDAWVVKVTPMMLMYQTGAPQPQPLKEEDANVPGWAHSKVDSLALDIHKALAKYQVQTVPGAVPAGSSPPAEAGSAAPASAGSADAGSAAPATP